MFLLWRQIGELSLEFLLDVVRFPYWWYSGGLVMVSTFCWRGWRAVAWRVAWGPFARYLFTPMYGDYSYSGRAVSLVVRLVLLLAKSVRLTVASLWYLMLLAAWCVLLPVTILFLLASR